MKLPVILSLVFSLSAGLAVATDTTGTIDSAITSSAPMSYVDGSQLAGCVPRPFPACYTSPAPYNCPLTPDEIAFITCTGRYAG
jgi:hypothetical protein